MPAAPQEPTEWVDGFLFVANQPALDFLNTRPVLDDGPQELLPDVAALERWLIASGIVSSAKTRALVKRWRTSAAAEAFLRRLIAFRERLRAALTRQEAGLPISEAFVAELNQLLLAHPSRIALRRESAALSSVAVFEPQKPDDLWAPIAALTAELLSNIPAARVRQCEGCVLHFYDTSKKGSRRWCSMSLCGNKVKVAAYQRRHRTAARD